MLTNETRQDQKVTVEADKSAPVSARKRPYESPRIVTHSAEELGKTTINVNACASFIP